jgi:hypothetical protein
MLNKIGEKAECSRSECAHCQWIMIGQEQAYRFIQLPSGCLEFRACNFHSVSPIDGLR